MAEVNTGARTMQAAGGKRKLPSVVRDIIKDTEDAKHCVIFVGTCDVLPVKSPDYDYSINGKIINKDSGVVLKFFGEQTRPYDLRNKRDLADVEVVREWLAEGRDSRIRRFKISEQSALQPKAPFAGFDSFSVEQVADFASALAAESKDPEAFIGQCIAYEASKDNPREAVIEALSGSLDAPVESDMISAPVTL